MTRLSRAQSREQTRERIRAAARQEFSRRGYGATSIDIISEVAGFSRGAFYANYHSKQDLLLDMMSESHQQEIAVWHNLVEHIDNFEAFFVEVEERFNTYAAQRDWWLLHAELQLEAERHEKVGDLHRTYSNSVIKGLKSLLVNLFSKAGGATTIDEVVTATALRALAHGLMYEAPPALGERSPGRAIVLFLRAILALSNTKGVTA